MNTIQSIAAPDAVIYHSTDITASLAIVVRERKELEAKLAHIADHYMQVAPGEQDERDRYKAFCYEVGLGAAPERLRATLREECGGCSETVYAVLNDCIRTKNVVILSILKELHGQPQQKTRP